LVPAINLDVGCVKYVFTEHDGIRPSPAWFLSARYVVRTITAHIPSRTT
jgi:hypothetical protein